jgi:5-methylcytosine-specific restriction protein A
VRAEALFLNGVWDDVLQDILKIQAYLPEQILYLQPYSSERIVHLAENPPSVDDPVRLLVSITDDLARVHYIAEIIGWDDKRELGWAKLHALNRVIYPLQPTEEGVYLKAKPEGPDCVNLLYVRRLRKLSKPFSVDQLTVTSTGQPHSTGRSTSGGWSYVVNPGADWLEAFL